MVSSDRHATASRRHSRGSTTAVRTRIRLGAPIQNPDPGWPALGPKYAWLHLAQPLMDGEPLSAFVVAAMAGDITASLANWGTNGLQFINVDYTLTLSRLPRGPYIGVAAQGHCSHDGVASGSATLSDLQGPIGHAVSVALAHSGFLAPTGENP